MPIEESVGAGLQKVDSEVAIEAISEVLRKGASEVAVGALKDLVMLTMDR